MPLTIRTPEQIQEEFVKSKKSKLIRAIDKLVEDQAKSLEYNGAAHLASYVSSTNPIWKQEAEGFVAWRDDVWQTAIDLMQQSEVTGTIPNVEEVIELLPKWE